MIADLPDYLSGRLAARIARFERHRQQQWITAARTLHTASRISGQPGSQVYAQSTGMAVNLGDANLLWNFQSNEFFYYKNGKYTPLEKQQPPPENQFDLFSQSKK